MRNSSIVRVVSALLALLPLSNTEGHGNCTHSCREEKTISILFTGDILLDRGVRKMIGKKGADALFSKGIDSLFSHSDIIVGNLECPVTHIQAPVYKKFIFRAEPAYLKTLKKHGFTHLNLCNNHSIDQGREGLMDTQRNIQKAGMISFGAGKNMQEAAKALLLCSKPRKVWLLTSLRMALENMPYMPDLPSVSQEPIDSLIAQIREIKKKDSYAIVLVSLHWGGEHTLKPIPAQRMEAHCLIDAGADALICHHTHTLQTIETYKGRPIYYSIGNFIFDLSRPLNTKACIVRLDITPKSMKAETIPIEIRQCVPIISTRK